MPKGNYKDGGYQSRQVIDFNVSVNVTEYRAQVLVDTEGKRYIADFPEFVTRPVQYGPKTKASVVYLSQYQLMPYKRIKDYFSEQIGINISSGSIFNFNQEAYNYLKDFENISKDKLAESKQINADETGININAKRLWLHTACNHKWTHFYPHQKRGHEATDEIGILPRFQGILCHDYWKAYYHYKCTHSLCNAHLLRELKWSEEDKQNWAKRMHDFLKSLNVTVDNAGGCLNKQKAGYYRKKYQEIIKDAQEECPLPDVARKEGQRGRIKRSKSRNLLERLITREDEILRFMVDKDTPFTNNQSENDLRMTKVQQKISGCFRSMEGAYIFCRIRGYLITCRKHHVNPTTALECLFKGKLPDFVYEKYSVA